jgi:hypothetical protein
LARSFGLLFALKGDREFRRTGCAARGSGLPAGADPARRDAAPALSEDGSDPVRWLGAIAAAALTLHVCRHGRARLRECRCRLPGVVRGHVAQSITPILSNACASRTTVAAYRARQTV